MIYRRVFNLPAWRHRNPFGELERMRRQMDRLFDDAMSPYQAPRAGVFPLINLTEDKDNYHIRAELPGVKAEDLDIQVTGKNIALSGERKIESENAKYHRREREAGKFSRLIALSDEIDPAKVEAKLDNGVLIVRLAKAETAKPRQIAIAA